MSERTKGPNENIRSWFPDVLSWLQNQIAGSGQPTDSWHLNNPVIQAFLESPSASIPTSAPPAPMETAAPNYGTIPANLGYGVQDYAGSTREAGNPFRYDPGYSYFGGEVPARSAIFLRGGLPGEGEWYKLTNAFTAMVLAAGLPLQDIVGVNLDQWGLVYGAQFNVNGQITDLGYMSHGNMWGEGVNPWNPPSGGYQRRGGGHRGGSGAFVTRFQDLVPTYPLVGGVTDAGWYESPWSIARGAASGELLGVLRLADRNAYAAAFAGASNYPTRPPYAPDTNVLDELGFPSAISALAGGYVPGYAGTPDWAVEASLYRSMNFISALSGARMGGLGPSFLAGATEWAYRGGFFWGDPNDRFQFATGEAYYAGKAAQATGFWGNYYRAQEEAYGTMQGLSGAETAWYGTQASSYLWGDAGLGADVRLYGWIFAGAAQGLAIGAATGPYVSAMYQMNPQLTESMTMGPQNLPSWLGGGSIGYGASPSYLGMAYGYQNPLQSIVQNVGMWGFGYGGLQAAFRGGTFTQFGESMLSISFLLGGLSTLAETSVSAWNRYQRGMPVAPTGPIGTTFWENVGLGIGETAIGLAATYQTGQGLLRLGSAGQLGLTGVGFTAAAGGMIGGALTLAGMEYAAPRGIQILQGLGLTGGEAKAAYGLSMIPAVWAGQVVGSRLIGAALDAVLPESLTGALAGFGGLQPSLLGLGAVSVAASYEGQWMQTLPQNNIGVQGYNLLFGQGGPFQPFAQLGNLIQGFLKLPSYSQFIANPVGPSDRVNQNYDAYLVRVEANYQTYENQRMIASEFINAFQFLAPTVQQHLLDLGFENPSMMAGAQATQVADQAKYNWTTPPSLADYMLGQIGAAAAQGTFNFPGTATIVAWAQSISIPIHHPSPNLLNLVRGEPYTPSSTSYTTEFAQWGNYQSEFSAYTGMSMSDLASMEHRIFNPETGGEGGGPGAIVGHDAYGNPITASEMLRYNASQYTGWQPEYSGLGPASGWTLYKGQPPAAPSPIQGFSYSYSGVLTYGGNQLSPYGTPYNAPSFATAGGQLNVNQLIPYGPAVFGYRFPPAAGTYVPASGRVPMAMDIALGGQQGLFQGIDPATGLERPPIEASVDYGGHYVYRPTQPLTLEQLNYLHGLGFNVTPGTQPGGLWAPGTSFSWQYQSQFGYLQPSGHGGYRTSSGGVAVGVDPEGYEGKSLQRHGWWFDGKNWHLPDEPKPVEITKATVTAKPTPHYNEGPKSTNESAPLINQISQHLVLPEAPPTGMTEADVEVVANRVMLRGANSGIIMRGTDRIDHLTGKRFVKQIWPNLGQESYQKGSR